MKEMESRGVVLMWLLVASALGIAARPPQGAPGSTTVGPIIRVNSTGNGTYIDVYGSGDVYDASKLVALVQPHAAIKRIGLHGLVLPDPVPAEWGRLPFLRTLLIDCVPSSSSSSGGGSSRPMGRFGSDVQLESLRNLTLALLKPSGGSNIRNVTIVNCGIEGNYGRVWRQYLSDVQVVNLSGNALTGDFTSIDDFDTVCTDSYGDDYGNPDCSSTALQWLDVSRNRLSGRIGTGAALGDDVTDAVCSTGCISLVLEPGVTDEDVLCRAPLVIFAMENPDLARRRGLRYASGYVTRDTSNWCWVPDSLWVLPTMWGVFLGLMVATLGVTLYARLRLKRIPFRIKTPTFDVLARDDLSASGHALNGQSASVAVAASAGGGGGGGGVRYLALSAGGGSRIRYVELAERQAMIPKTSVGGGGGLDVGSSDSDAAMSPPSPPQPAYMSLAARAPAALPVSTPSAAAAELPAPGGAGADGVGRSGFRLGPRGKIRDPNGMREALTAGIIDSSDAGGGGAGGGIVRQVPDSPVYGASDLDPGPSCINGSDGGTTLGARAAAGSAGGQAGAGGGGGPPAEPRWRVVCRAVLSRGLEILGMQLRTLLILGMFGLECYWAYSLILYRGGWQLLVLVPNYLEHTLAGVAMLRALMAGTHGRWKFVAPVPLLPFAMSSCYLVYGFVAYPFGLADVGPISWEKFVDLMDSCGVLSSTCWAIFSSLAYWNGNSIRTSYQYFNTDIFVGMLLMCFTDLLSTAHHLASTLQVPFKQWLRRELDVRRIKIEPDKSHRLVRGDGDL